jgi:BirA family biotin operon repressor/biotin-[acetyl-CoA-carboxylase] ligase
MHTRIPEQESHLTAALGAAWNVRYYDEVESTMLTAKLEELAAPGLVLAERQRAGKGRLGRTWSDPGGAFLATYTFSTAAPLSTLVGLPLVVGLAVQRALAFHGGVSFLKWPNDVLDEGGKKIAGVLVDVSHASGKSTVQIGIGVNLQSKPAGAQSLLDLAGVAVTPIEFAQTLSEPLRERWESFSQSGFGPFKGEWERRACWLGSQVSVALSGGEEKGTFVGLSPQGALILQQGNAKKEILAGDVTALRVG